MLAAHVQRWEADGRVVLFDGTTGRSVALDPGSVGSLSAGSAGPLVDRLAKLGMIAARPLDRAGLIACRSRLPLLRGEELWHPVPSVHTAGGHAWTFRRLTAEELAIWRAINDARSAKQVAAAVGRPVEDVLAALSAWTAPEVQAVQLRDTRPSPADPSLSRVVSPPRDRNLRTDDQHDVRGATDLVAYHLAIDDGPVHFDDRETTVAHAFGLPHPAFGGRTFGDALFDALAREGFWAPARGGGVVVEVGCGDGEVADALSRRLSTGAADASYVRVDLSPGLLATQAGRAPQTHGVLGDARRLPLRDGSVACLVSNEVIADLPAVPRDGRWHNEGAWQFVEEIARVLVPGGRAYVSEFGTLDTPPEEAVQLDHPEVGIQFTELAAVARRTGLAVRLDRMDAWLGMDPRARQLWRPHHMALRAMCRRDGRHLPARAWTPDQLAAAVPFAVDGLQWVPITEDGPGPVPSRFFALRLEKARQ